MPKSFASMRFSGRGRPMKAADLELLTFVNGEKASDGTPLAEGDSLTFDLKGFVPGRSIWGHGVTLEIDGKKGPSLSPEDLRNGTALTAPAFDTSLSGCLGSGRDAVYGATFVPAAAEPAPDPQPEPEPEPEPKPQPEPQPEPEPEPAPDPEPTGDAIAQTAEFGEESKASSDGYGFQLVDSGGTPLSGVTVTGGTATGVAVSSDGILRPATDGAFAGQDGATVKYSSNAGTGVCTLRVVTGESVGTIRGLHSAMQESFASDGGKIIRVASMLDTSTSRQFEPADKTVYPSNPTRIIGKGMGTGFTHGFALRHASNVKFEALEFACPDHSVGKGVIDLSGYIEQPSFTDCYIHGLPKDPLGDYSEGFGNQISNGIYNGASGRGSLNGLTLTRCKIYDVNRSINMSFGGARTKDSRPTFGYYRTDNIFVNGYSDGPGQSFLGTAKDMEIVIDGDVSYAHLGSPTDKGNPHIDNMFQVISASNNQDDRITNLTLRNTVTFETSLSNGRGSHGTFTSFEDSLRNSPGRRVIFVNPLVENNISIVSGNHHFTFRCEGGTIRNNTLASPAGIPNPNPGHAHCYIKLEANNDDPILIERNISGGDASIGGVGSPTISGAGNVNIGLNGSSLSGGYADVFKGVGADYYSAENWTGIIAAFTPKDGSSVDGAGAVGSDGSFGRTGWHPGPAV